MKIAFINCLDCWGGGEKWHLEHALYMQSAGHDVVFIALADTKLSQIAVQKGLNVQIVSSTNILNPLAWRRARQIFRQEHFEVVVMNSAKDMHVFAPSAHSFGVRRIIFRRGSDIKIGNNPFNRYYFRHFITDVLANSMATKRSLQTAGPDFFPEDKIRIIYNGIDTHEKVPLQSATNDTPLIVTLGRLSAQKRHDLLVLVADKLRQRGLRCTFAIGGDGELEAELQSDIRRHGLTDIVDMPGHIEDRYSFIAKADIFVLTSQWEGFGYVLAEAMLMRKPIVAFNVSSNPELIVHRHNGLLVDWPDVDAFADAVQELVNNPELRHQMGNAGHSIVCQRFDFDQSKKLVEQYLTEI